MKYQDTVSKNLKNSLSNTRYRLREAQKALESVKTAFPENESKFTYNKKVLDDTLVAVWESLEYLKE